MKDRSVAFKVRIADLLSARFVKNEVEPGYFETPFGRVSRINIIATVVGKENAGNYSNLVIDDGSGKISVRSFDQNNVFSEFGIGDVVLVIGRAREFGSERYIVQEIIKRVDDIRWLILRAAELKLRKINNSSNINENNIKETNSRELIALIKKFDSGEGADYSFVVRGFSNAEEILNEMIMRGEVFEPRPGKIKVLE